MNKNPAVNGTSPTNAISQTTNATPQRKASYKSFYLQFFDEVINTADSIAFYNVCCPFHDDDKPSAGISKTTGVFHCFACNLSLTMPKFLNQLQPEIPLTECYALVDAFRNETTVIEHLDTFVHYAPAPSKRLEQLHELSLKQTRADLPIVVEYCIARSITYATLEANGVGFLRADQTHWERDSLVFPYSLNSRIVGLRYRDIAFNKGSEPGCHFGLWGKYVDSQEQSTAQQNTEGETFHLQKDSITMPNLQGVCILVEGESDNLATYQAIAGKYAVYSSPTATFRAEWKREFDSFSQVIFIPQADSKAENMLRAVHATLDNVTVINLPWKRRQVGNDVADWLRYNATSDLAALIDSHVTVSENRVLTGVEFEAASNEPRVWLIDKLLAQQQIGVIGGPPKAKKTFLALNLMYALTTGTNLFGIPQFSITPQYKLTPPNFLIIEEEGSKESMRKRLEMIYRDIHWQNNTFWAHHLGVKIDTDVWIERLKSEISVNAIDIVIIDPFQRTYKINENEAQEQAEIWSRLQQLLTTFPHLVILIIHHFTKSGKIEDRWQAFRGSGRIGAEVDLGIFVEKMISSEGDGAKMSIEGRDIETPLTHDGKEVFYLHFEAGRLAIADDQKMKGSSGELVHYLKQHANTTLDATAKHFNVTTSTIRNWADECIDTTTGEYLVKIDKARTNKPTYIRYIGTQ